MNKLYRNAFIYIYVRFLVFFFWCENNFIYTRDSLGIKLNYLLHKRD